MFIYGQKAVLCLEKEYPEAVEIWYPKFRVFCEGIVDIALDEIEATHKKKIIYFL